MYGFLLVCLAAVPPPAIGPTLDIPAEVRPAGQWVRLTPATDAASVVYVALDGEDPFPSDELKDPKRFLLHTKGITPGRYRYVAVAASATGQQASRTFTVVIDGPPVPPVPPGPTPIPPSPPDPPAPAPIPGDGLRVLVVYESADLAKYPPAQQAAIYSGEVRAYLRAKCPVGADGKTPEWRMWDKDTDLAGESPLWQAAMKRDRKSVPWVIVSNGKAGYEGPLPGTAADLLSLLKKYGGDL